MSILQLFQLRVLVDYGIRTGRLPIDAIINAVKYLPRGMGWLTKLIRGFFSYGGKGGPDPEGQPPRPQGPAYRQPVPLPLQPAWVQPRLSQQENYDEVLRLQRQRYLLEKEAQRQHQRQKRDEELLAQQRRETKQRENRKPSYADQLKERNQQNQYQSPPPHLASPTLARPPPPPTYRASPPARREDDSDDTTYETLRAQERLERDRTTRYFEESREARESGDRIRAEELSNKANLSRAERDRLNAEASERIFTRNNLRAAPNEFDLHGLYVKEAVQKAEECLYKARKRGDVRLRFIVGKGLHSSNQTAKVKPAIEQLIRSYGFEANLDPKNSGVLVVRLDQ